MGLFALMRMFTIRVRMLGPIAVVLVVLGMYALMWARGAKQWLAIGAIACALAASLATSDKVHQRLEQAISEARNSDAMEITSLGGRINF